MAEPEGSKVDAIDPHTAWSHLEVQLQFVLVYRHGVARCDLRDMLCWVFETAGEVNLSGSGGVVEEEDQSTPWCAHLTQFDSWGGLEIWF